MTTETIVKSLQEDAESGHCGLVLGAFLFKVHKKGDIDFKEIGEAARARYGDRFERFCLELRIEFKAAGFDLQAAAQPQQAQEFTVHFTYTGGGTGNTTSGGY